MSDDFDAEAIARSVAKKRARLGLGSSPIRPVEQQDRDVFGDSSIEVPDFTEVMIGWRAWGVPDRAENELDPNGFYYDPPLMHSVTHGSHVWLPREVQVATCRGAKVCKHGKNRKDQKVRRRARRGLHLRHLLGEDVGAPELDELPRLRR